MEFIDLHSVFKNNLVISSIPNYSQNSITGNLNAIPDARIRNIISKGPKYRFPSIDFP